MAEVPPIDRAVEFIRKHWKEGKALKQIAALYGVDPGNLARAFRKREGKTVKEFIDGKRKEHVLELIAKKNLFGHEIGTELGFADDLAFYRWVKRAFDIPFTKLRTRRYDKKK